MSASIDELLQQAVRSGAVANVAAMAADRNGVIYEGAVGPRAAGSDHAMTVDSHLRVMSMTKMVATSVALQQVEQGALELDAPVDTYRPEFAAVQVLDGFDGDTPRLRAPASRATVKQLITHTAGFGYWFWNADLTRWESLTGTPNVLSGSNAIFTAPLVSDPGTKWEYGINTDWLGKVIETVSGRSLDVAIKEGITGPLGMAETAFSMTAEQGTRCVPIHVKGEDGSWVSTPIELPAAPEYRTAGHGLYSTPRDYLKFQRALLNDGALDGVRILEAATVADAFRNQIGDLDFPAEIATCDPASSHGFAVGPGYKWGYGLLLNAADIPGRRRAWSGAWAGLCNSHFWIDRAAGITGAIYSQSLPFVPPESVAMYQDFETALYASL